MKGPLYFLVLFYLLNPMSAKADQFDDLFQGVDMKVKPKAKKAKKDIYKQFIENLEKKLLLRSMFHTENPTPRQGLDDQSVFVDSRFEIKSRWKKGKTNVKLLAWAEYGNQESTYRGVTHFPRDTDQVRRILELNELELVRGFGAFDLTYGKKVVKNTLSTLYSPADRVSPVDLMDPMNPKKLGVWLAGADFYKDETTWTFYLIPFFTPNKESTASSRWSGTGENSSSFESLLPSNISVDSVSARDDYPANKLKNAMTFLKWKTVHKGFDLFASAYHGPNYYPVIKTGQGSVSFITEYVNVGNYSTGFSTTKSNFEFHGEALFQYSFKGKDENYINWVLGTNWTIDEALKFASVEQLDWTFEYAREEFLKEQYHPDYSVSSRNARPSRDVFLTRMLFKFNEDFRLAAGYNYDFDQSAHMETLGFEYKLAEGLKMYVHGEFFSGTSDTHYGQWEENDRIVSTFEYIF